MTGVVQVVPRVPRQLRLELAAGTDGAGAGQQRLDLELETRRWSAPGRRPARAPGWTPPGCTGVVAAVMPKVCHCCAEPLAVAETAYALLVVRSAFWGVVQTVLGRAVWMCQSVSPVLLL